MHIFQSKKNMMLVITFTTLCWLQGESLGLKTTSLQASNISLLMEELLDVLCPSVDICNMNATNAKLTPKGLLGRDTVSCCTGCSCHPDCKERSNCCYPNTDTLTDITPSTRRYQCLYSAVINPDERLPVSLPAYQTVVASPANGCIHRDPVQIESGLVLYPSCDGDRNMIRSYFPVYSKSTGEIYKNIECAMCNGVDIPKYLNPMFICLKGGRKISNPFSVILYLIDTGKLPTRCYILFRFNEPRLLSEKRCYHSVVGTCQKDGVLEIPRLDMPDFDIGLTRVLCENGVYSPFQTELWVYRNVFCYICGHRHKATGDLQCHFDEFGRSGDNVFISILDPTIYLDQGAASRQELYPEACMDVYETSREAKCYRVICPLSKTMNREGRCVFISDYITSPLNVYIKLIPVGGEDIRLKIRSFDVEKLQNSLLQSNPWPDDWRINNVYLRQEDFICKEKAYIFVDLASKKTKLSEYIPEVEQILKFPWTMSLNGTVVVFRQSLREYELSSRKTTGTRHIDHEFLGCDPVTWRTLIVNLKHDKKAPVLLTKLYFCHQIKLDINDFELTGPRQSHLKSNVTKFVLARFQFELVDQENGYVARVCLEDTILKQRLHNRGIRHSKVVACLMLLLSILIHMLDF